MPPPKSEISRDLAWLVRALGCRPTLSDRAADSAEPLLGGPGAELPEGVPIGHPVRGRVGAAARAPVSPQRLRVLLAQLDLQPRLPAGVPTPQGSVGFTPGKKPGYAELKKLYVERAAREHGLGGVLCALAESKSRAAGYTHIDLWSDTRFLTAHRFYEKRGYRRSPGTRELHDSSNTVEHHFEKPL